MKNLVEFNRELENKIQQYETEYRNNILTQMNITEQLNEESFQELLNFTQTNPLTRHYIDRTTIGRFQTKLYERVPHTSPVYKTPTSSPFYRKSLGNSSLRSSPRLHPNHRLGPIFFTECKFKPNPQISIQSFSFSSNRLRIQNSLKLEVQSSIIFKNV